MEEKTFLVSPENLPFSGAVVFPEEMLMHGVYLHTSPTGVVNRIYYEQDNPEEVLHIQKYMASAISGHLEDASNGEWSYVIEEADHLGKSHHTYSASKTETGRTYGRKKRENPEIPHFHEKEYTVDSQGHLTKVFSHEHLSFSSISNDSITASLENKIYITLLSKRIVNNENSVALVDMQKLINDTLLINVETDSKTYTLNEARFHVEQGLKCSRQHKSVSNERAKCVMDMRSVISKLSSADLYNVGMLYLNNTCPHGKTEDSDCQHDRNLLIDIVARLGSPISQSLVIKYVFGKKVSSEIQRSLFHFIALDNPTEETVEFVAMMCFGKKMEHHGILKMKHNQKRACMTLGGLLNSYVNINEKRTHEILGHLHTWLHTDRHLEPAFHSKILRDPHNFEENKLRTSFVHAKTVLLHALGNAAHPRSKPFILPYTEPNTGHAGIRHVAIRSLRQYNCKESATHLLNASIHDEDLAVKSLAYRTYMEHSRAGDISHTDANILISKNRTMEKYLRVKRSSMCNLIEKLSFDLEIKITSFDWSKKIGNDFLGASFGIKLENYAHLHLSPLTMFFDLNLQNRAWIDTWVKIFKRRDIAILNAEACFVRNFKLFNLSTVVDFNVVDKIKEFADFDDVYDDVVNPMIEAVNTIQELLNNWEDKLEDIDLGLGIRDFMEKVDGKRDDISNWIDGAKDKTNEWIEETFGGMMDFIDKANEVKGNVINKKDEITDKVSESKEIYIGRARELCEAALNTVKSHINTFLQELGWSFDLSILDGCLEHVTIIALIQDADEVGEMIVECMEENLKDKVTESDKGLMGQMNKLLSVVRDLQIRFQNITVKISTIREVVESIKAGGWRDVVKLLIHRNFGLIDGAATELLDFINSVLDEMGMNLQYIISALTESTTFIGEAVKVIKDSPLGAIKDIERGAVKMRIAQALFGKLKGRFTEIASEMQGKLPSWMEGGDDLENVVRNIEVILSSLRSKPDILLNKQYINHQGSPRDTLQKAIQELESMETIIVLLEDLLVDLKGIRYLSDDYRDSFVKVINGMKESAEAFESLKRSSEGAKSLVQKTFGIKFHPKFPIQMKSECDDQCGGCGIYPNTMRGRQGAQLLAEIGHPIVAPFDSRVVPIKGSSDELMIYPLGSDVNDYEIIISFITPVSQIFDLPDGYFADAGVVIGHAVKSPCQPNFIHASIRKFNSSVTELESKSNTGVSKAKMTARVKYSDGSCEDTTTDEGEYVPVDDMNNVPDPNPLYEEGCQHAEFKHIKSFFDIKELLENLENMELDFEQIAEDVGEKIEESVEQVAERPKDVDERDVESLTPTVEEESSQFSYELQVKINKQRKNVEYYYDDEGKRQRKISFNFPEEIPKITDFFNTMNFSVESFGQFLLDGSLTNHYDRLLEITTDLAMTIGSKVCGMLNTINTIKLRHEISQSAGTLAVSKDLLKAQLEVLMVKGCKNIFDALNKGEEHLCEVDATHGCHILECITLNKFDSRVINLPLGIAFDPCTQTVVISIAGQRFEYNTQNKQADVDQNGHKIMKEAITTVGTINISAVIDIEYSLVTNSINLSIKLLGCDSLSPVCYGFSPIFSNLTFDGTDAKYKCVDVSALEFPCQDGSTNRNISEVIQAIKGWKMNDLLYSMDRYNKSRKDINIMIETPRLAVLDSLTKLTKLTSSIQGTKEIFKLPDLKSEDTIEMGPWDITFFVFKIKYPPLTLTISAGGIIEIGLDIHLQILSSNVTITPKPSIAGYAEAKGKCSVVVAAIELKLRGILLETIFNFITELRWSQTPVNCDFTFRVDLIPLGVEFQGAFKVLGIPIEFMIFEWQADLIEGNPHTTKEEFHDDTPPAFEWESNSCLVEQVPGRHWSDPAFIIEAPFSDPESLLYVKYAIGSFKEGTDVLGWSDMEGVSMTVPMQLGVTGVPLHFTVKATNTDGLITVVSCILDTYDVTPATGRFEAAHVYTSNPNIIRGTLMAIEDSPLVDYQYTGVGLGRGYIGDQIVEWYNFTLEKNPVNKEGEGELAYFAAARPGKLTSNPMKTQKTETDLACATICLDFGDSCVSFDFDYKSQSCDLQWTIEGSAADLVQSGAYHNFEKLAGGYTAYFDYGDLKLIHGESYYLNTRITNVRGFESYLTSQEIIVDFTPPQPGPIGKFLHDEMRHDSCEAAITQSERCIEVTPNDNHRYIIDGIGAETVFNGNFPNYDMLYTINNHYLTANWDGFHDDETDIWGYTWAAGTNICDTDIQEWDDPHSHLADKSHWTHQGLSSDLSLPDGPYYVTTQALNSVVLGGALVTTVCHSIPIIVDTSAPWLDFVENIFYDEDYDIMGIYYQASDPESGIMRTDIGLGETKHDVFIRAYSRHDPLHDGYEMVSVDAIDLPIGVPVWVRIRVVNNVDMLTADNAPQPLMMDVTAPVAGSVFDGSDYLYDMDYQPYNNTMCVQWYNWFDPESGIDRFVWSIGSTANDTDVLEGMEFDHFTRYACIELSLNQSDTYYNTIKGYNKAINSRSTIKSSDGVTVDMTEPEAGWVNDGKEGTEDIQYSSHAASIFSNWDEFYDPESGIEKYVATVFVNELEREVFTFDGEDKYLEDHTMHFKQADFVQVTVEAENGATLKNKSKSSGYFVDLTPPEVVFLRDHPKSFRYQVSDTEIYAHWLFQDPESYILEYRLRIIEHSGKTSVQLWPWDTSYEVYVPKDLSDNEFEVTVDNLDLQNGKKYSVEVTAINKADLGNKQESLGVIVDNTRAIMSKIYIGYFGGDEDLNDNNEIIHDDHNGIQASWIGYDHESGIVKFMIAVGTHEGDTSVTYGFRDFGTVNEGYIDGISLNVTEETGTLYYVSIFGINGAGEKSDILSSKPIHVYGENTPGVVYDGREVYTDAKYSTDTLTLAITFQGFSSPACGIRAYEWALGRKPGYSDILPFSSYGIAMINTTHALAEIHLPLQHNDLMYASVRAHTGHRCSESILYSCSDGILIDILSPKVSYITIGVFANDTANEIQSSPSLYQSEYDSIALQWNTTDDASDTGNDTWMAGSLPQWDDIHKSTITVFPEIPINSINIEGGETVLFTVKATDMTGNTLYSTAPPLTVDITPPIVEGFRCTEFISVVKTEVVCLWRVAMDNESPIVLQNIAIGEKQMQNQIVPYETVPHQQYSWSYLLDEKLDDLKKRTDYIITLQIINKARLETYLFSTLTMDITPAVTSVVYITTPITPETPRSDKACQQSITTMEISWENLTDPESSIHSYEVGIGSGVGMSDIYSFENVGNVNIVFLDHLNLPIGKQVYASVRAVNQAKLISAASSYGTYISANPSVVVLDGLETEDIDYQNDLSTISGQVYLSDECPTQRSTWSAFDILGNIVVNKTDFYQGRFANDELRLENFKTYYVIVEISDIINRTYRAKSDGFMTAIQPPRPGEVRDGLYIGEDRNYQESTSVLSLNWDAFGDENDPLENITSYDIAIGDNPAYPDTRTNVHYFHNVGLDLNHTFYNLRLTPKRVQYFATVRGYSNSGAYIDSISNGIWVGYSPGMTMGKLYVPRYTSNSSSISFYWKDFTSDFKIIHYRWGIGKEMFADDNVTLPCHQLIDLVNKWASVQSLVDEGSDKFAEKHDMKFLHSENYYILVVAEDEASQCISSKTEIFTVDTSPPIKGIIHVEGNAKQVQYTTSNNILKVVWENYKDDESDIKDFIIELKNETYCDGSPTVTWQTVRNETDVKDKTQHVYVGLVLKPHVPYRIIMTITNGAGLVTTDYSDPIFLDQTPVVGGDVKDGDDWEQTKYYQSSQSELKALFAVSPKGTELNCPLTESMLFGDNSTWTVLNGYVITNVEGNHYKDIYIKYEERNVVFNPDNTTEILFHYNISTLQLEGGLLESKTLDILEGEYTARLRASSGENVIFSWTLSNGWLDEYIDFELPIIEDPLTDEEFMNIAKGGDLDFDRGYDVSVATTTEDLSLTTPETTTEPYKNLTEPEYKYWDSFDSNAFGLHILGFPFGNNTKRWLAMVWSRDLSGVKAEWIYLNNDPAKSFSTYKFDIEKDVTEPDALWNVNLSINDQTLSKLSGLRLPENYTMKTRHWTYNNFVPQLTDPFDPFYTTATIEHISIPLPKERPCQFGKAFYDMESGMEKVYVGVGNPETNSTVIEDNVVPFHLTHQLCHSCELICDYYKCSNSCTPELIDGYQMLKVHLYDLYLDPGSYESDTEVFVRSNMFAYSDDAEFTNSTAYFAKRYHILIKIVNEAGLESISASPGIKIDVSPPVFQSIEATDPDYDPLIPTAYQRNTDSLAAWWVFEDNESPIWEYKVGIGTSGNVTDVSPLISVGTATTITLKLDVKLTINQTYYLTVQAINAAGLSTFASTDGVTIHTIAPDVSNTTSEPLFSTSWPEDGIEEDKVYVSDLQNKIGITFDGKVENNVYKLEWCIGESLDDNFIAPCVEIDRQEYDWALLEIREDGFFWFTNVKSGIHLAWLAQKTAQINMTMDDEYIDPGHILLEPGRCVHHKLYAQNMAHIRTLIAHTPVCVRRSSSEDYIVESRGEFDLKYIKGAIEVSISSIGIKGALISSAVGDDLFDVEYGTSANVSFASFIVNPWETQDSTTRVMTNRIVNYTDRAVLISPAPQSYVVKALRISLSFEGITYDTENESIAILYWDKEFQKWFNIEESSSKHSEIDEHIKKITGWFSGSVKDRGDNQVIQLAAPHLFALFIIRNTLQNSPPMLLKKIVITHANSEVNTQLKYYDKDDDVVTFKIVIPPDHGYANITEDGILTYIPQQFYYGLDKLTIMMKEQLNIVGEKPHAVDEIVHIYVKEESIAPFLFLELVDGLNKSGNKWKTFADNIEVQYEANTTNKVLGNLFLCDLNPNDSLQLLLENDDENMTITTKLVNHANFAPVIGDPALSNCCASNLKIYQVEMNSSMEYYGNVTITFIGKDNYTLYSQPVVVNVYTLVSPCGIYGECTSENDPYCTSNARSKSFDNYDCSCDTWHKGAWCDIFDVLKITMITIGTCWMTVIVLVAFVKTRENLKDINRVFPSEEVEIEMNTVDEPESEESETEEADSESEDTTKVSEDERNVKRAALSLYDPDAIPALRYKQEYRTQAYGNWSQPNKPKVTPDIDLTNLSKTEAKLKKMKIKKRKIKKTKVSPK